MTNPESDGSNGSTADAADDALFAQTLKKVRDGNTLALNELIATWRTYLLYVANDEIDPRLRQKLGASDLVQSACLEIQQHLGDFRGSTVEEWRVWLRRLLVNDLHDARRRFFDTDKRAVARERPVDGQRGAAFQLSATDKSPRSELIAREEWEQMQNGLRRLSEEYREVLRLRNWEQLPFAEIGSIMSRSEDAAQKLWSRAIVALQQELDQNQSADGEK